MVKRFNENEIDKLAEILNSDGVICVPTDTVYGLCAKISSEKALKKLIEIKNRPINKSFPIMCADMNQIKRIAIVNKISERIINNFMPGPITLVLEKQEPLPEFVTNGKDTVAVRLATSETLKELITLAGSPVFMTSANKSGMAECTNLDDVEKVCPLLDGMLIGNVVYGKSSTIVDCTSEEIKILREGPISIDDIIL